MARAYGANASLLAAFESTYGSTPVDGYWQLPFVSTSLGSEQGLIANDLIGLGRDPSAPIRDVIKVEGDMVVPLDVRHIGLWLKALLGEPTSVGTGVMTHTFASGKPSLPSRSARYPGLVRRLRRHGQQPAGGLRPLGSRERHGRSGGPRRNAAYHHAG